MGVIIEPTQTPPTQDAISLLGRRVIARSARGTLLLSTYLTSPDDQGYRQFTKSPTKRVKGPYSASAEALAGVARNTNGGN